MEHEKDWYSLPVGAVSFAPQNALGGVLRGTPVQTPPRDLGAVSVETQRTDEIQACIAQELDGLRQALDLILRPSPPATNGRGDGGTPIAASLAGRLSVQNARLAMFAAMLQDIRSRIDL